MTTPQSTQKNQIKDAQKQSTLAKGSQVFIVSKLWWDKWKAFTDYDDTNTISAEPPGAIDNSTLCEAPNTLKSSLKNGVDFEVLNPASWKLLTGWFPNSGPSIMRTYFANATGSLDLELNLLKLEVFVPTLPSKLVYISRGSTMRALRAMVAQVVYTPPHLSYLRIQKTAGAEWELVPDDKLTQTTQDYGLVDGMALFLSKDKNAKPREAEDLEALVDSLNTLRPTKTGGENSDNETDSEEEKAFNLGNRLAKVAKNTGANASNSGGSGNNSSRLSSGYGESDTPGVTGLYNLGNTCYMNSAIQCLSNSRAFTQYFLRGDHQKEINKVNVLGSGGKLALEYSSLVESLWKGKYGTYKPVDFKNAVSRLHNSFIGYKQHDSQELLSFVLDGLHEDLNRITNPPYVELKSSDGRLDEVVAKEAWIHHLRRNQSIVVDLFHGQLKSTVTCPDPNCRNESVKFDPFMFLSLPLPVDDRVDLRIFVVFVNPFVKRRRYLVKARPTNTIAELKRFVLQTIDKSHPQDAQPRFVMEDLLRHEPKSKPVPPVVLPSTRADPVNNFLVTHLSDCSVVSIRDDNCYVSDILHDFTVFYEIPSAKNREHEEIAENTNPVTTTSADQAFVDISIKHYARDHHATGPFEEPHILRLPLEQPGNFRVSARWLFKQLAKRFFVFNGNEAALDTATRKDFPFSMYHCQFYHSSIYSSQEIPYDMNDTITFNPNFVASFADSNTPQNRIALHWNAKNIFERGNSIWFNVEEDITFHTGGFTSHEEKQKDAQEKRAGLSLEKCVELFQEREKLGKDDEWYCNKCKKMQQAYKMMNLWKTPKILVVHLKRFRQASGPRKNDTLVRFPLTDFDLSRFILSQEKEKRPVYDLFAISEHKSGGLESGHYIAYGLNHIKNQWYNFDDARTTPVTTQDVLRANPYMLFYVRRDEGQNPDEAERQTLTDADLAQIVEEKPKPAPQNQPENTNKDTKSEPKQTVDTTKPAEE